MSSAASVARRNVANPATRAALDRGEAAVLAHRPAALHEPVLEPEPLRQPAHDRVAGVDVGVGGLQGPDQHGPFWAFVAPGAWRALASTAQISSR